MKILRQKLAKKREKNKNCLGVDKKKEGQSEK
jgi:hypothetical protein